MGGDDGGDGLDAVTGEQGLRGVGVGVEEVVWMEGTLWVGGWHGRRDGVNGVDGGSWGWGRGKSRQQESGQPCHPELCSS